MTKSTEKSKLKGKKVNVVGRRGLSKATKGSFLPLEHENSNEEKESESNSSKPVLEEEASRSSGAVRLLVGRHGNILSFRLNHHLHLCPLELKDR